MILRLGSTGDKVREVQKFLGLSPDGVFGKVTETSVKKWQSNNKLTPDGVIGPKTWGMMFPTQTIKEDVVIPKSTPLKLDKLKDHIPVSVIAQIPETAAKFNITNPLRLAHFLAQCSHESAGFKAVQENLNYSADGLKKIFPKYFPGNLAESYARNPEKIASKVYGGRMGNGDETTKEGWKFRGRGYIQLTGKQNYTSFAKFIGEDTVSNPDLVATKYPLASAAFFFDSNRLWSICDRGADDITVTEVTRRVNGGTIGLSERIKEFKHFYKLLS
jgi:putative chitinase